MASRRKPKLTKLAHWSVEEFLEHSIAELSEHIEGAALIESFAPVAALTKQRRECRRELDQLRTSSQAQSFPANRGEHLTELIEETRAMKAAAQVAGSYVAASNLSRRELEAAKELEEWQLSQEPEEVTQTLAELVAGLEKQLQALPPVIRAGLLERLKL